MERISSLLAHPRSIVWLALAGMLLNILGLTSPPFSDDFLQWAIIHKTIGHDAHPGALLGLFDLVSGSPEVVQQMKDSGRLPWSASESLQLAFWRPLTELTHWVDHLLWPRSATLMRLHSLAWYGALVLLLGRLYRMLDPSAVRTGLATAIFAASCLHFFVVMWISARNQLLAACFCVLTIMCHHLWRTRRDARYGALACLALAASVLSAEAGIATVGYLLAYALAYEKDAPWSDRLRALMPYLLVIVLWRMAHVSLGFGSAFSGSYINPGLNVRFLHALMQRLPTLLLAELTGISAGITQAMSDAQATRYALGAAIAIGLWAGLMHHFKLWSNRLVRFYALGALLALIPVCAINPTERVLLNSEMGMSAVLAALFCRVYTQRQQLKGWLAGVIKATVVLLFVIHGVLFPATKLMMPLLTSKTLTTNAIDEALALPKDMALPGKNMILVNPPAPFTIFYYPLVRSYYGQQNPSGMYALANGLNQDLHLTAVDDRTIHLESDTGFVQPIVRDVRTQPFKPGDTVRMGQITVTVTKATALGEPLAATFHFPTSLEDERWQFLVWQEPRYIPMPMPAPGQTIHLARLDMKKVANERLRLALKGGDDD